MLGDGDHRIAAPAHQAAPAPSPRCPPPARPGPRRAAGRRATGPPRRPARSTTRRARAARSSAAGTPPTTAKGRCSMAPAAVLATVGDSRAERWRGSTTPVTPAHSALRSSAPRLRGSVMPAATSRNGACRRRSGAAQVLERHRLERAGQGQHALGRLGAGLGVEPGPGHGLDRDPHARPASSSIRSSCGEGSWSSASRMRRTVRRPTREQLEHGPAPLDLVAAELAARAGPAIAGPPRARVLAPRPPPVGAGRGRRRRGRARGGGSRRLHQHDGQAGDALGPAQGARAPRPGSP